MDRLRGFACLAIAALLSASADAAGPEVATRIRVVLAIENAPDDPYVRRMIAEASAIWHPYGVGVVLSSTNDVGPGDVVLAVSLMPLPPDAAGDRRAVSHAMETGGRLGAIRFCDGGVPEPVITLDSAAVRALLATTRARVWQGSPATVGRALGRVLAHEIGHFLLAFPAHTQSGLMRASFNTGELSELARWSFALDAALLDRLRARLTRLTNDNSR
jgi:hypothetical protein